MSNSIEHGNAGHINTIVRDQDSVITGYGKHARVIAFLPDHEGLYCRVDMVWGLRQPTIEEVLTVARKDQGIKGNWVLDRIETWETNSSAHGKLVNHDYYFVRVWL